ncbi:MAG: hypothetical protein ACYCZ2_07590 [Lutibacter sp.]
MKSKLIYLLLLVVLSSCASLPKATVEMSVLLEQQITGLEKNHLKMVNLYFEERESLALEFLNNEWYPMFLDNFFKEEAVVELWEETVNSKNTLERTGNVKMLTVAIQENYMGMRDSLFIPIQRMREEMRIAIMDEYKKARTMNAAITNNIASVNDIQEKRKELLLNFIDYELLENKLNEGLAQLDNIIDRSQKVVDEYKKNETKIEEIINQIKK